MSEEELDANVRPKQAGQGLLDSLLGNGMYDSYEHKKQDEKMLFEISPPKPKNSA